jgi:hypothetical protein
MNDQSNTPPSQTMQQLLELNMLDQYLRCIVSIDRHFSFRRPAQDNPIWDISFRPNYASGIEVKFGKVDGCDEVTLRDVYAAYLQDAVANISYTDEKWGYKDWFSGEIKKEDRRERDTPLTLSGAVLSVYGSPFGYRGNWGMDDWTFPDRNGVTPLHVLANMGLLPHFFEVKHTTQWDTEMKKQVEHPYSPLVGLEDTDLENKLLGLKAKNGMSVLSFAQRFEVNHGGYKGPRMREVLLLRRGARAQIEETAASVEAPGM